MEISARLASIKVMVLVVTTYEAKLPGRGEKIRSIRFVILNHKTLCSYVSFFNKQLLWS
jgi:hypothetical protein